MVEQKESYLGLVSIHGKLSAHEADTIEGAGQFVKDILKNAQVSYPNFPDFLGRVLRVQEVMVLRQKPLDKTGGIGEEIQDSYGITPEADNEIV